MPFVKSYDMLSTSVSRGFLHTIRIRVTLNGDVWVLPIYTVPLRLLGIKSIAE